MVEVIERHTVEFPQPIRKLTQASVKNILLINPNNGGGNGRNGFQVAARTEPTGLEYVAGAITDIVQEVALHDDASDPGGWKEKMNKFHPDIIGISCNYTVAVPETRKLAKEIREIVGKDVPIVVGGHAISLRPEYLHTEDVDAIVIGAGEETFRNLVEKYGETHSLETVGNIHYRNADGEFVSNVSGEKRAAGQRIELNSSSMDKMLLPRTDLADPFRNTYYMLYYPKPYTLRTADGCTHRCIFCSVHKFNKDAYRSESPEKTIKKIESIPDGSFVVIPDDFAFLDVKGWNQIADHLIQTNNKRRFWAQTRADHIVNNRAFFEKLHRAGLSMLLVGFESFDSTDLKKVGKGIQVDQNILYNLEAIKILKELGIDIWGAQILFPHFTRDNFLRLAEFNNEKKIEFPQFAIYTPLPGTTLYNRELKSGNLTGEEDPRQFDLLHSMLPTVLPPEKFHAWRDFLCLTTGHVPASKVKRDIEAKLTTMQNVKEFSNSVKQIYDTPGYRELKDEEDGRRKSVKIPQKETIFEAKNP